MIYQILDSSILNNNYKDLLGAFVYFLETSFKPEGWTWEFDTFSDIQTKQLSYLRNICQNLLWVPTNIPKQGTTSLGVTKQRNCCKRSESGCVGSSCILTDWLEREKQLESSLVTALWPSGWRIEDSCCTAGPGLDRYRGTLWATVGHCQYWAALDHCWAPPGSRQTDAAPRQTCSHAVQWLYTHCTLPAVYIVQN